MGRRYDEVGACAAHIAMQDGDPQDYGLALSVLGLLNLSAWARQVHADSQWPSRARVPELIRPAVTR